MSDTEPHARSMSLENLADLLAQGDAALAAGDTGQAMPLFEQALTLAASQGDEQNQGPIYQRLGRAYAARQKWSKAATCYEAAAAMAHNLGTGFTAYELQAYHQASQAYLTLTLATPNGPGREEAYEKAQAMGQTMLDLACREGNGLAECMAWASLGNAQQGLGDYEAAAKSFGYAFAIAYEAKDIVAAADYLVDLGYTALLAGNARKAGRHYRRGLTLLKSATGVTSNQHPALTARLYDGLAEAHLTLNRPTAAHIRAQQAVDLAQQARDPYLEARHRSTWGHVLTRLGDYEGAVQQHQAATELLQTIQNSRAGIDLVGTYGNLASCYRLLGRYQLALEVLARALDMAREIGDRLAEGKWQDTLGSVYEEVGDFDAAERCHRRALHIFEKFNLLREAAIARNNLGTTFYRRGLLDVGEQAFETAETYFDQAQSDAQQAGDILLKANATGNLGIVHLRLKKPNQAVKLFQEAHNILKEAQYNLEAGHQLENLGLAYAEYVNEPKLALDAFNQAIQIARKYSDIDGLRLALTRLGDLYRKQYQDTSAAQQAYEEAVELLEKGRTILSLSPHRAGLLARNLAAYEGLVQLHWQAGHFAAAFDWAERVRARTFLEQLGLFVLLPLKGLPDDILDEEKRLIRHARMLEQQILKASTPIERVTLAGQRREIQDDLSRLWDNMALLLEDTGYVDLRRGKTVTVKSLQALLKNY